MWVYEKRLQIPVDIKKRDLKMAKDIYDALGGSDGELNASMQYLHQRYTMPTGQSIATLNDIGTEELAHLEIVASMIYQLTDGATIEEIKAAGLDTSYAVAVLSFLKIQMESLDCGLCFIKADPVADNSNMSAEQKARASYEHLLD